MAAMMIKNKKQLANARRKIQGLDAAMQGLASPVERRAYQDLISAVQAEIDEFVSIDDGSVRTFTISSLDEVGVAAIQARLAAKLTQAELAAEMGVSEQQVQKDEARDYETSGIAKVAEVLDVLGYELVGSVRPKQPRVLPSRYDGASTANVSHRWEASNASTSGAQVSEIIVLGNKIDFISGSTSVREGSL